MKLKLRVFKRFIGLNQLFDDFTKSLEKHRNHNLDLGSQNAPLVISGFSENEQLAFKHLYTIFDQKKCPKSLTDDQLKDCDKFLVKLRMDEHFYNSLYFMLTAKFREIETATYESKEELKGKEKETEYYKVVEFPKDAERIIALKS